MKHTLKSIFNLTFVLLSFSIFAQKKESDSIAPKTEKYGIRVGADLYKIARSIYDEDYKGFEVTADYRFSKRIYFAGELGNENKTTDEAQLNFTTKGTYFKFGADYNMYENWLDMENLITLGMRYGFSSFTQDLNSYSIYNPNSYFNDSSIITEGKEFSGLSAHWLEAVVGMKAEIFDNLYIGVSVRMNYLLTEKEPEDFENLYIPGFNRTYDGKFGVGFNYTLSYFIPIYKKQNQPKVEKKVN